MEDNPTQVAYVLKDKTMPGYWDSVFEENQVAIGDKRNTVEINGVPICVKKGSINRLVIQDGVVVDSDWY